MNIGEYIKQLRIDKGLSQEELGKIVGVQRAAVQKWESGVVQNLKRNTIQKLASYFDVSPANFISENEEIYDSSKIPTIIGNRIHKKRKDLGLTMLEVAQKVGVSEATVSRWESGDIANMRRDRIALLAKALNVSISFIIDLEDNNNELKHSSTSQTITSDGQQLLNKYNQLNDLGKEKANEYVDILIENQKYTKEDKKTVIDFNDKVRTVDSDDELKAVAYGDGNISDDETVKHT